MFAPVICGTASGGFTSTFVRPIVKLVTSWSDTTPTHIAGAPSWLATVRGADCFPLRFIGPKQSPARVTRWAPKRQVRGSGGTGGLPLRDKLGVLQGAEASPPFDAVCAVLAASRLQLLQGSVGDLQGPQNPAPTPGLTLFGPQSNGSIAAASGSGERCVVGGPGAGLSLGFFRIYPAALTVFRRGGSCYPTLMLAARITWPHFSVSSTMNLPKSAGEPTSVAPPKAASRALILGSVSAALVSSLSLLMI